MRAQPNTGSTVIAKINFDETYTVTGCDAQQAWWQIDLGNGSRGWVFGSYTDTRNAQCVSGVTNPADSSGSPTGYSVTAAVTVNIRSQPSTGGALLGQLPRGQSAAVVGRNASATWWQINRGGIVGWVSAAYAQVQAGANYSSIPVTG